MSDAAKPDFGGDDDDRVIDRSGDIDQRPLEERAEMPAVNIVSFRGSPPPRMPSLALPSPIQRFDAGPPISAQRAVPVGLAEIAQRLQKDLDKQFAKAKSQLEALTQKIVAQEKRCLPPRLDDELQNIRLQRQKVLMTEGPVLAGLLGEERSRLADLERFKAENQLFRTAHYPASPALGIGILLVLVLVEACINGVLFAETSDQGLFGGWLEAVVLSITNVGTAFLFGHLVLPQLHRRTFFRRAGAIVLALAGFAAIVAINLCGAHYRDFKAEIAGLDIAAHSISAPKREASVVLTEPKSSVTGVRKPAGPIMAAPSPQPPSSSEEKHKQTERDAIRKGLDAPFELQSFASFFLLIIGLCGATIAACDGYKFDDPFPGYGKRHRRHVDARAKSASALQRILNQSNAIMAGSFQAISRKIESHAQEISTLLDLHRSYAGDHKALTDSLEEAARDAEAEIACHERLANKVPHREALDAYAIAMKQLPALSDKHVKFQESQERKLKSLQKSVQKEQDDALLLFSAASADFQKLLAEASHASLQTALVSFSARDDSACA